MLFDKRIAPNFVQLEPDEERRITRAVLSFELGKLPSEIDAMPVTDVGDLLAVHRERIEAMKPKPRK